MSLRKAVYFMAGRNSAIKEQIALMERLSGASNDEIREYQDAAISKLLESVCKCVPYYKALGKKSFSDMPIITKSIIRENLTAFLSTEYTGKVFSITTSGSTGSPFTAYSDARKKASSIAELVYFNNILGCDIGERSIFLRSLTAQNKPSKIKELAQNAKRINVAGLSDSEIRVMLSEIAKASRGGALLSSYASTLDAFRDYAKRNGDTDFRKCNITGIVSGSELLYDDTREAMERCFETKCVSRYANQENGVIAQDGNVPNYFTLNNAHYYVEVLRLDLDDTAAQGETGRIVITDLHNTYMPFIRYDTGDVGALCEMNGVQYLTGIDGRRLDMVYDCNGKAVSPHRISVAFWAFPQVLQFRFTQTAETSYTVLLHLESDSAEACDKLKATLYSILGSNAEITIMQVDEIPMLSSGKCRYIENTWKA